MSIDIYGQICYGVKFECEEFPWDKKEFNYDISKWWVYSVLKYSPPEGLAPYDIERQERIIYNTRPLPVSIVNYAGLDVGLYIIAVPSTVRKCAIDEPIRFNLEDLTYTDEEEYNLIRFVEEHITKDCPSPQWWASCYFVP